MTLLVPSMTHTTGCNTSNPRALVQGITQA
jgi:hypothetical protein